MDRSRRGGRRACAAIALAAVLAAAPGGARADDAVVPYRVVGDEIPEPLAGLTGDPARGRAIAAGREGNCLACHRLPIPEEEFHGDVGPDLGDVGDRLSAGQLRLRLVDPKRVKEDTVMPAFHVVDRLERVAHRYRGRPILGAQQVEDVVAYLKTLGHAGGGGAR